MPLHSRLKLLDVWPSLGSSPHRQLSLLEPPGTRNTDPTQASIDEQRVLERGRVVEARAAAGSTRLPEQSRRHDSTKHLGADRWCQACHTPVGPEVGESKVVTARCVGNGSNHGHKHAARTGNAEQASTYHTSIGNTQNNPPCASPCTAATAYTMSTDANAIHNCASSITAHGTTRKNARDTR